MSPPPGACSSVWIPLLQNRHQQPPALSSSEASVHGPALQVDQCILGPLCRCLDGCSGMCSRRSRRCSCCSGMCSGSSGRGSPVGALQELNLQCLHASAPGGSCSCPAACFLQRHCSNQDSTHSSNDDCRVHSSRVHGSSCLQKGLDLQCTCATESKWLQTSNFDYKDAADGPPGLYRGGSSC